jgi:hypothetical protein
MKSVMRSLVATTIVPITAAVMLSRTTHDTLNPEQLLSAQASISPGESSVAVGRLSPETDMQPAAELPPAQRQELVRRHYALRDEFDARVNNSPASPPGLAATAGAEVQTAETVETEFHTPPAVSALVVGRNSQNTRANSVLGASLAEPTAVAEGSKVFYTGNTHAEFSIDGGATFPAAQNVALPAGPANAPFVCCDLDSVYDKARGVTVWSALYLNGTATQGTVRLFVRRQIAAANNCFYDVTPGVGIVPDYPHLGLGNNSLYLTTNNLPSAGPAFLRVTRFNLDAMADCAAVSFTTFALAPAVGQRVVTPVEGTLGRLYFAYHENATQIRIFTWPDTAAAPVSVLRTITAHNHVNPDCRGGLNNTDWIQRSTAFSISGFRMRGAVGGGQSSLGLRTVGWWWNVSADAATGHNQAHVHAAMFRESDLVLVAQPHIFDSTMCTGYPAVAANARGDLGISLAKGGRAGGGGPAVMGFIGLDDEFTPGIGNFSPLTRVAFGTHNPAGTAADPPRWGDYVTVRTDQPCDLAFVATSYAHNGGTGVANVNARYVEFLRGRDNQCYIGWRDETRIP